MPKDFIKKYLPHPDSVKHHKSLAFLGELVHEPNLWHLNRHCVTKAFAIGLFWGCIPMPFQMVAAAFMAVRLNANLPLSVMLVWFSNPVTMPPIFYFEYLIGAWLLDMPPMAFDYELSVSWIKSKLYDVGVPLFLGAIICGVVLSSLGYWIVDRIWQRSVRRKWELRQQLRMSKNPPKPPSL
ncbi:MAG: DUF2062 domain-containing protein [Oleiphilaceae bacterium]|nr:DUF2062 domain-containing protein [Oleiphilaceae bacterium]